MEDQPRYVSPKLYAFQVAERPQIYRPIPASPRLIKGVEITNKIPAKQGQIPIPPAVLESSFLITNAKPPVQAEAETFPSHIAEEDQGFPYDDQSGVLLGSARPLKQPQKQKTASVFPTSVDPIEEIRGKARAKVQNWLRESEEKRTRGLNEMAKNYKK